MPTLTNMASFQTQSLHRQLSCPCIVFRRRVSSDSVLASETSACGRPPFTSPLMHLTCVRRQSAGAAAVSAGLLPMLPRFLDVAGCEEPGPAALAAQCVAALARLLPVDASGTFCLSGRANLQRLALSGPGSAALVTHCEAALDCLPQGCCWAPHSWPRRWRAAPGCCEMSVSPDRLMPNMSLAAGLLLDREGASQLAASLAGGPAGVAGNPARHFLLDCIVAAAAAARRAGTAQPGKVSQGASAVSVTSNAQSSARHFLLDCIIADAARRASSAQSGRVFAGESAPQHERQCSKPARHHRLGCFGHDRCEAKPSWRSQVRCTQSLQFMTMPKLSQKGLVCPND